VSVECEFLAPIRAADGLERAEVARRAQAAIGAAVRGAPVCAGA
jgi:hypothetical protein